MKLELNEHFLIATPSMSDPRFEQAVIYICSYQSTQGAMGLVINKPLNLSIRDVLQHLNVDVKDNTLADQLVLLGGPLGEQQGFLLRLDNQIDDSKPNISMSSAKQELIQLAEGNGPENILVFLGYCSWTAGQVEKELKQNAWLVAPASAKVMFATPHSERWRAAAALVGVDFNRMTTVGHA